MILPSLKYVALPAKWPGRKRPAFWKPKRSPFKGHNWSRIEKELLEEIARINGRDVSIALDIRNPGHFRQDGGIRADARPVTPSVVLTFTRPDGKKLVFPCDAYAFWQDNIWAIRLSLEALRAVDRHGVTAGDQQYEGFAALPPGSNGKMSEDDARALIAELSGIEASALAFQSVLTMALRTARSKAHPDAGGSTEKFQEVEEAAKVLEPREGD